MTALATVLLAVWVIALPIFAILGGGYLLGWAIRRGWTDAARAEDQVSGAGTLLARVMSVRAPWWVVAAIALVIAAVLLPIVLARPGR